VLSDEAMQLFSAARKRGVDITISTNSLASTDNVQAFSGYRSQCDEILGMGIKVYEYQPYPEIQKKLLKRFPSIENKHPIFAIHAKTMVIDSKTVFIGTYNLDPRSQNLNTEVGIIATNEKLATYVSKLILFDTEEGNSWLASTEPDKYASTGKRLKVFFWQLLPLQPIL
jgi:putative cardiolipin synthase